MFQPSRGSLSFYKFVNANKLNGLFFRIEISRTSIAEIQICIDDEKEIKISDEDRHQVIPCKKFSNLQTLDLRENRLKTLQKMKLDKLKDLFLSGNIKFDL